MNLIILLLISDSYLPFESFWDFYSDNRISSSACGRGYTGVASTGDISSVFINPASLSLENKRQYYFEYTYKNNAEWTTARKLQELHPNFSAGHAFLINDFLQIGMTYRTEKSFSEEAEYILHIQRFIYILNGDSIMSWGGYTVNNIPYGDSIIFWGYYDSRPFGDYTENNIPYGFPYPEFLPDSLIIDTSYIDISHRYNDLKISSFSIPIAINFKNIIRIGVDINYTTFYSKSGYVESGKKVPSNATPIKFSKIIPKFGFIYSPMKNLSFGMTYTPKTSESITLQPNSYYSYTYDPNIFPSKIGIGISYKFNSFPLCLSLDYIRHNNSIEENLVNRNDIHLGLEYDISNNFKVRTGFFTQRDYRNSESQEYDQENLGVGNYNQIFTTLGLSYKISFLALNLSLMDSHLFSSGSIEQTYLNTGITYGF